jgi:hypothetical protein
MKVLIILIGIVAVTALIMSIMCLLKKEKFDFLAISDGDIGLKQVTVPDPHVVTGVAENTVAIAQLTARVDANTTLIRDNMVKNRVCQGDIWRNIGAPVSSNCS